MHQEAGVKEHHGYEVVVAETCVLIAVEVGVIGCAHGRDDGAVQILDRAPGFLDAVVGSHMLISSACSRWSRPW